MSDQKISFIEGNVSEFKWHNEPQSCSYDNGLIFKAKSFTDFWQRTHYDLQRDDGHCYLAEMKGDFCLCAHLEFSSKVMYDQCGILLRIDRDNWVKASIEYESEEISRLGSVVTNLGYSDWATTDISTDINSMWYRLSKNNNDVLLENSNDGIEWKQMRVLHLHKESDKVYAGIYACSPKEGNIECKVNKLIIKNNIWK